MCTSAFNFVLKEMTACKVTQPKNYKSAMIWQNTNIDRLFKICLHNKNVNVGREMIGEKLFRATDLFCVLFSLRLTWLFSTFFIVIIIASKTQCDSYYFLIFVSLLITVCSMSKVSCIFYLHWINQTMYNVLHFPILKMTLNKFWRHRYSKTYFKKPHKWKQKSWRQVVF